MIVATIVVTCALFTFPSARGVSVNDFIHDLVGRSLDKKSDPPVFSSKDDSAEALDLESLLETSYMTIVDLVKQVNSGLKSVTSVTLTGKKMAEDVADTIDSSGEIATHLGSELAMKDLLDSLASSNDAGSRRQVKSNRMFKSLFSSRRDDYN